MRRRKPHLATLPTVTLNHKRVKPVQANRLAGVAYGLSLQTGLLLLLLVLCPSCIRRPEPMLAVGSGEIELSLLGFRNSNGQALVSLFRDPEGFPDRIEQSVVTLKVNIDGERALVRLGPFPWGRYAISLLHDENGDGQMNSSWLGTPLEGFGFAW